jgi:hypothetical protein
MTGFVDTSLSEPNSSKYYVIRITNNKKNSNW